MPISQEVLDQLAISQGEYEAIVERLGREPNHLEIGLFGSMWSEHCGYKHSKPLLRSFNTTSDRMLVAPGSENAGSRRHRRRPGRSHEGRVTQPPICH